MTPPTPRRRWIRWAVLVLALLLLLPLGAIAVFALTFDANAWKPRIEAAVQKATGRGFHIEGPIATRLSLRPTITLREVRLDNPPGFSRPVMAAVRRAEVQLALLPLLSRRAEIARLALDGADVLLERDAAGRPNWVFAQPPQPEAAPQPSGAPSRPFVVELGRVELTDASLGWLAAPGTPPRLLGVRRLGLVSGGEDRRLRLDGTLVWEDRPVAVTGETGPLAPLLAGEAAPWPVRLSLAAEGGAALTAEGTLTPPNAYHLTVAAKATDLAALAPLLPDQPLPPLRDVAASAVLQGAGGPPAVSAVSVTAGASDLALLYPGLALEKAELSLPAPDQPLAIHAAARVGAVPVGLEGQLGAPVRLLAATGPAWPVGVTLTAGEARLAVSGSVADPRAGTGFDLKLVGSAPDLSALAPLLPARAPAPPPLRQVSLQAGIAERGPFFAQGAMMRDLRFASSAGDVAGALTYATRPRQGLTGQLTSTRFDLDALRQALAAAPAPAPKPATPAQPGNAPAQPAPAAPRPAAGDRRVIPDIRLPLEALRLTDSDLTLSAAALRAGGMDWRDATAHAVLKDGRGRLDPATATLAGAGRLSLRAAADITGEQPVVQLALETQGFDLGAVPAAGGATGKLGIDANLRGRGRDLRALAADANGHLGLTLQDGAVPAHLLEGLLAGLRQRVPGIGDLASRPLALGCVAARLDADGGIARPRVLLAETSLGRIGAGEGAGTIDLRDERLALRLNTDLRLPVPGLPNGLRIRAPVPVTGTLAAPRPEWNAAAGDALQGEVADRAERALGREAGQLLGALGGAIAGRDAGAGPIPDCAAALALARGQAAPAAAAPAPPAPAAAAPAAPPPAPAQHRQDAVQELIRRLPLPGLFGR